MQLSERLDTAGHGFRLAVKYFLPKLLASPITHAFLYFDYVGMLLKLAPCTEDMEGFQQVINDCLLSILMAVCNSFLHMQLDNLFFNCKHRFLFLQISISFHFAIELIGFEFDSIVAKTVFL